jgi:hypothetical protein
MPRMNEPVVTVKRAEKAMTALKEANQRQKEALDRLLDERKVILDLLYQAFIHESIEGELDEQIHQMLIKNGYFK